MVSGPWKTHLQGAAYLNPESAQFGTNSTRNVSLKTRANTSPFGWFGWAAPLKMPLRTAIHYGLQALI